MGEGLRHFDPQALDVVRREQAGCGDDICHTGRLVDFGRVASGPSGERGNDRNGHQSGDQPEEQEHWIGQLVTGSFDPAKNALGVARPFPLPLCS